MHQRVAAINDLSGLGRCSLTVDIAILAAMGIEACPLPTAVLTSQTGYPGYRCVPFTKQMYRYTEHWRELQVSFQGILSGYLATPDAAAQVQVFLERFHTPGVLYLCDPVLGDNGKAYRGFTPASIQAVRQLAFQADILTPNLTEFCILTDTELDPLKKLGQEDPEELYHLLKDRAYLFKDQALIITGIPIKIRDQQLLANLIIDHTKRLVAIPSPRLEGSYSGTGDIFAAILMGSQLQKRNLEQGVHLAGELIVKGIADAQKEQTPCNDGINYEPYLGLLSPSSFQTLVPKKS